MITKDSIARLKKEKNGAIAELIGQQNDTKSINRVLQSLGRLPADFDAGFLFDLLEHPHKSVRLNAVKNIGKLKPNFDLSPLVLLYEKETETTVRREIISSLGRHKQERWIGFFIEVLAEDDPKIVSQAIRSLLVFKEKQEVQECLKTLAAHPNEMVRSLLEKSVGIPQKKDLLPHAQTYDFLKNKVVHANVLEALPHVPQESVHLTFTSPPYYNARDYSIYPSYEAYLAFLEKVFTETHRITKEGRFLVVNTSPIILPRASRAHSSKRYPIPFDLHGAIVKNGWDFIDDIVWLKPETSVKNRVGGFMQHRKPLGYKPNTVTEYLMVYRKHTPKLLDWNMKNYPAQIIAESKVADGYETSNVWKIDPCFDKVHSAVFPMELCKRVIQYYSYKGDLVFDPFAGSGTLGRTAKSLERLFFLTEQDATYFDYMKKQARAGSLFDQQATQFQSLNEFIESIGLWQSNELHAQVI